MAKTCRPTQLEANSTPQIDMLELYAQSLGHGDPGLAIPASTPPAPTSGSKEKRVRHGDGDTRHGTKRHKKWRIDVGTYNPLDY